MKEKRIRYFLAVEGESERSFIKWLNQLADDKDLHIALDCEILNGGGYKTMLEKAILFQKRHERKKAKASILIVDSDHAEHDDNLSLTQLKQQAEKKKIHVYVQTPNHEGLLFRMMPGKETLQPKVNTLLKELRKLWPEYQKAINTQKLTQKFSLADLYRTAAHDSELKAFLALLGFYNTL